MSLGRFQTNEKEEAKESQGEKGLGKFFKVFGTINTPAWLYLGLVCSGLIIDK